MVLEERVEAVVFLGEVLRTYFNKESSQNNLSGYLIEKKLFQLVENEKNYNPWFTKDNVNYALKYWSTYLTTEHIEQGLLSNKEQIKQCSSKTVGIIAAGNIPMVSFHDILSVFLCGHKAKIKLSSKDSRLLPFLFDTLAEEYPEIKNQIEFCDGTLQDLDAIIATGSDNSNRYFETYFGKYPHIFRHHRSGIAVLGGNETFEELEKLSDDVFLYFGLGCRNVSKIYVPQGYKFDLLLKAFKKWEAVFYQHHYINNYDYQKSILILNKESFIDNDFVLLKENEEIFSPLSVIFYEYYSNICNLATKIEAISCQIQCVVSKENLIENSIRFGESQHPDLWDYADHINVINFLNHI
jgi:hypothetical protein